MIIILGSLSTLAPFAIDMYLSALPAMAGELQTSASMTQLSLTFFLLGLAFGQLVAGPISDAKGRRLPMLIGMSAFVAASLLVAASDSVWLLLTSRLLQGFAAASGMVISRAIARDHFSGVELTTFFGLLTMVGGFGPIVAPVLGGFLLQIMSWHGLFIVLAIIGTVMVFAIYIGIPESLQADKRITGGIRDSVSAMLHILKDRLFLGYVGAQSFTMAGLFAYIAGSPFLIQEIYGATPQQFSLLFALNGSGFLISTQIATRLVRRFGAKKILFFGLILNSVNGMYLLGILLLNGSLGWVLLPLFLIVASIGFVGTTSSSLALQSHPEAAGSAAAWLGLGSMLLGSIVSPLAGIGGTGSAVPLGIVIAGCGAGGLLCYAGLISQRPNERASKDCQVIVE